MKKWFSLLILVCLLGHYSRSEDVFDLAEKFNGKKKDIVGLESEKRKILSEIYSIESETNKLVDEKADLDFKKAKLDKDLKHTSIKIVELEKELKELTPQLTERLSFTEKINNLPWLYTLLTAQNIAELDQIFSSAQRVNQIQADQVSQFITLLSELEIKRKELEQTAIEIVKTKKDIQVKEVRITTNQKSKKSILGRLEKKITQEKQNLKTLKSRGKIALSQSEFKDLGLLFGMNFFDQKGELPHPIQGPIVQNFGINNLLNQDMVNLVHKGIFYQAPQGAEVRSVAAGRVRYLGSIDGLGQTLVIDHGGRYYSVYSNLHKVGVKPSSEVKKQQKLGQVGHRHLQFSSGLYFEIRHFSQPQNPKDWLKAEKGNLATL